MWTASHWSSPQRGQSWEIRETQWNAQGEVNIRHRPIVPAGGAAAGIHLFQYAFEEGKRLLVALNATFLPKYSISWGARVTGHGLRQP